LLPFTAAGGSDLTLNRQWITVSCRVAVSLITGLSALSGAAITGCLALLTGRAQLRAQLKSTELERNEQHAKDAREIRRDAYLGFMGMLTQIDDLFDRDIWSRTGFGKDGSISKGEIMYTVSNALRKLSSQLDLIRLEGPPQVSEAAVKVYTTLNQEMMQLMVLASPGARDAISSRKEMYILWKDTARSREEVKVAFIKVASEALQMAGLSERRLALDA
jgi:hypothetical protein